MEIPISFQANIVKAHGRNYAAYIFLRFKDESEERGLQIRKWFAKLGKENIVTSHYVQCHDSHIANNKSKNYNAFVCSIAISYNGFKKMKIPNDYIPCDKYFRETMLTLNGRIALGDRYEVNTSIEEDLRELDGILMVYHSDFNLLEGRVNEFLNEADFRQIISGHKIDYVFNAKSEAHPKHVLGPLGFTDGHSQSKDIVQNWESAAAKETWQAEGEESTYGSYLAIRKLEVNDTFFRTLTSEIAKKHGISEDFAAALFVGRFRNGTPLTVHAKEKDPQLWSNDGVDHPFDYEDDKFGNKCPINAHIRAINPRNNKRNMAPIVRRSMSYSEKEIKYLSLSELGNNISGLFFMSYQADLEQFKILFDRMGKNGVELLVYPNPTPYNLKKIIVPVKWGEPSKKMINEFDVNDITTFRGGEYFFAPSITFLKNIDKFPIATP